MNYYRVLNDEDLCAIGGNYPHDPSLQPSTRSGLRQTAEALEAGQEVVTGEDVEESRCHDRQAGICGLMTERFAVVSIKVEFNEDIDGVPVKGFLDCLNEDNLS